MYTIIERGPLNAELLQLMIVIQILRYCLLNDYLCMHQQYPFNCSQLLLQMGAFCATEEEKLEKYNRKLEKDRQIREAQERARARRAELENGVYAQKIKRYIYFYGRPVTDDMKKFIQDNYSQDYNSEVRPAGYPRYGSLTITYKNRVIDRFETANKNGTIARTVEFWKLEGKSIWYKFSTNKNDYDCVATFDDEDKFYRVIFNEEAKTQPIIYSSPAPQPKTNYYEEPQNNGYYPPPKDWGAHYAAETARANQQFRENMNRQAQDWNNYQQQRANRGW